MKDPDKNIILSIPNIIWQVIDKLNAGGFEAYIVGGCLRDLMLNREIND
jgi:tRNA nucleotidyltransferase/poly(A) polymerase